MRLIDADVLYEKFSGLEAQALDRLGKIIECNSKYDNVDRVIWSAILTERTAFKYDVSDAPTVDAIEIIKCKDCKHRILNKHYGEKGYLQIKAYCELDTGNPFDVSRNSTDDNWFCADAERKEDDT